MRQPSRFSEVGFESMKMGFFCCLDAQNGLTFTGTACRRFSPLSAGSSVLDALWIVAIILEQPLCHIDGNSPRFVHGQHFGLYRLALAGARKDVYQSLSVGIAHDVAARNLFF